MERKERRTTKKPLKKVEKKKEKNTSKFKISYKVLKKPSNFTLVFGILYIMLIILSIIGRVSTLEYTSTTEVTFAVVLKEFVVPFITAALFIVTSIMYKKKPVYGVALELGIGFSMVANVFVSVFTVGFDIIALLLTLIIPVIVIVHSILTLKKLKQTEKEAK